MKKGLLLLVALGTLVAGCTTNDQPRVSAPAYQGPIQTSDGQPMEIPDYER